MATDARGHTVPAASDVPSRTTLLSIAKTTRDITPVTNTTTRGTAVTAMAAESLAVATTNPLLVYRADARADSAIEVTIDGSTWRSVPLTTGLTTWTPTVASGLTVGNGVWEGWWYQQGQVVHAHFSFTFGTTSSTTGALLLNPVAIATSYAAFSNQGSAMFYDTSGGTTGRLSGALHVNSTASSGVGSFGFSTSGGQQSATVPMTWATGDVLSGDLHYLAA